MTLANPWDFVSGARNMLSTFMGRFIYRYVLGGALRALLCLNQRVFLEASAQGQLGVPRATLVDVLRRRRITLRQFDELFQAPLYGFESAWDYYAKISSCKVIPEIKVPCLAINSIDDPITGADSLPSAREVSTKQYLSRTTSLGGLSLVSGLGLADAFPHATSCVYTIAR